MKLIIKINVRFRYQFFFSLANNYLPIIYFKRDVKIDIFYIIMFNRFSIFNYLEY